MLGKGAMSGYRFSPFSSPFITKMAFQGDHPKPGLFQGNYNFYGAGGNNCSQNVNLMTSPGNFTNSNLNSPGQSGFGLGVRDFKIKGKRLFQSPSFSKQHQLDEIMEEDDGFDNHYHCGYEGFYGMDMRNDDHYNDDEDMFYTPSNDQ